LKIDPKKKEPSSQNQYKKRNDLVEPFKVQVSRDQRDNVLTMKKSYSNGAIYKPKYYMVEKKTILDFDLKKLVSRDQSLDKSYLKGPSALQSPRENELPPIIDKPSIKVKGAIPLEKQTNRLDPLVEAKRKKMSSRDKFSIEEWPRNYSMNIKLPVVDIGKISPRREFYNTSDVGGSVYEPKYEFVKKRFNQFDKLMGKVAGRKPLSKKAYYTFEEVYDYDKYVGNNKSGVYQNVAAPAFDKMLPRDRNPDSKLPSYLQGNSSNLSLETSNINNVNNSHNRSYSQKVAQYDIHPHKSNFSTGNGVDTSLVLNTSQKK